MESEDAIPLPVELLTPLRGVGSQLVDLVRGYAACTESVDCCGEILKSVQERWPSERRTPDAAPALSYCQVILRDLRLDELKRAVASLPALDADGERPAAVVERIEVMLDEARREAKAARSGDASLDWRRANYAEATIDEGRTQLIVLGRAIRGHAENLGLTIQAAVASIFELIDKRQRPVAQRAENTAGSRKKVVDAVTKGNTYGRNRGHPTQ